MLHEFHYPKGDLGLLECQDIDSNTPTSTYNGYLNFNGFLPKIFTEPWDGWANGEWGMDGFVSSGSFGNEWETAVRELRQKEWNDLKRYDSADNAMEACRKGNFYRLDISP